MTFLILKSCRSHRLPIGYEKKHWSLHHITMKNPVFDQNYPSPLILLVDKKYSDQQLIKPLSWFSPQKNDENLTNDITKYCSFQLL